MRVWKWLGMRLGMLSRPDVLTHQRHKAFDACIEALCETLAESACEVERATQAISDNFRALAQMTSEQGLMIERFGHTVGSLAHKGGNVSLANFIAMMDHQISAPIARMTQLSLNAVNLSRSTEAMFDRVGSIENVVRQVYVINNKTRMLTFNATIEAARAGEGGRGFAAVANEIKNLSEDINDMAARVRGELASLSTALREGQDALMTMSGIDVTADQLMRDELETLMQSLSEQHQAIVRCLDQSVEMARTVSAQVGQLTVNIQFQDHNTQVIHCVIAMLKKLRLVHALELSGEDFVQAVIADIPLSQIRQKINAKVLPSEQSNGSFEPSQTPVFVTQENIEMF